MVWDARRGVYAPPKLATKSKPTLDSPDKSESSTAKPTFDSTLNQSKPSPAIQAIDAAGREVKVTITGIGSPEKPKLLPVGSLVNVEERVWIGCNKAGGIGSIIDYHNNDEDGTIKYDVKYVLGGKETDIECRWVSLHGFSARRKGNK
jgi:hypothetical protein